MNTRPLRILFAGLALSLAAALVSGPVQAATNLNSSRSNIYKLISNTDDEAACVKAGGKVETKDGKKVCALPAATAPSTPTPSSSATPAH